MEQKRPLGRLSQGRFGDVPSLVAQFGKSNALQAERDGEFAAMVKVVDHDAPENPLTRERVVFPLTIWHQVGRL